MHKAQSTQENCRTPTVDSHIFLKRQKIRPLLGKDKGVHMYICTVEIAGAALSNINIAYSCTDWGASKAQVADNSHPLCQGVSNFNFREQLMLASETLPAISWHSIRKQSLH